MPPRDSLLVLKRSIETCRLCPRLVAHRERVAAEPPRRYAGQTYWARPVAGFGDPSAPILILGLAPAAHGANRTGRVFTGDRSGQTLFAALHAVGLASAPDSVHAADGLRLAGAYVGSAVRCAPPENKPTPEEMETCRPYLERELALMQSVRVVVALGKIGWDTYLRARRASGLAVPRPLPRFGHGQLVEFAGGPMLLGCFHPSQHNTFSGRLTHGMLVELFRRARALAQIPENAEGPRQAMPARPR
jgi:uracil-DNA glycosylase family 4